MTKIKYIFLAVVFPFIGVSAHSLAEEKTMPRFEVDIDLYKHEGKSRTFVYFISAALHSERSLATYKNNITLFPVFSDKRVDVLWNITDEQIENDNGLVFSVYCQEKENKERKKTVINYVLIDANKKIMHKEIMVTCTFELVAIH